jgi:hypothetical protein
MGDRPVFELDHKTPLQAANLPVINQLAKEGQCGTADPVKPGIVASTVSGVFCGPVQKLDDPPYRQLLIAVDGF